MKGKLFAFIVGIALGSVALAQVNNQTQPQSQQAKPAVNAAQPAAAGQQTGTTPAQGTVETHKAAAPHATVEKSHNSVLCTSGKNKRLIEVVVDDDVTKLPCKVVYKKETEEPGQSKIVWNSENTADYCPQKMQELADKLQGMGWDCQK